MPNITDFDEFEVGFEGNLHTIHYNIYYIVTVILIKLKAAAFLVLLGTGGRRRCRLALSRPRRALSPRHSLLEAGC